MIAKLQHTLGNRGTFDVNKTLKSIAFYSWITAGILFTAYLYFVGAITFSVIKEKGLQQDTKALISTMGQQELQYLSAQKMLTKEYAIQAGFITANTISFAQPQKAFAWNVGRE